MPRWFPHGYRVPYKSTRWVIPPGTRLHPAHRNRRESRKGPAKDATRDPSENRLGLLSERTVTQNKSFKFNKIKIAS